MGGECQHGWGRFCTTRGAARSPAAERQFEPALPLPLADFVGVSPFDVESPLLRPAFQLNLTAYPGQPLPGPPPPSTDLGTWGNPRVVPDGAAGLPYLSPNITASARLS